MTGPRPESDNSIGGAAKKMRIQGMNTREIMTALFSAQNNLRHAHEVRTLNDLLIIDIGAAQVINAVNNEITPTNNQLNNTFNNTRDNVDRLSGNKQTAALATSYGPKIQDIDKRLQEVISSAKTCGDKTDEFRIKLRQLIESLTKQVTDKDNTLSKFEVKRRIKENAPDVDLSQLQKEAYTIRNKQIQLVKDLTVIYEKTTAEANPTKGLGEQQQSIPRLDE